MKTGIRLATVLWILMACTAIAQERGIYDVYDFGAKGDGLANDTRSIQSAIESCFEAGGGKVLLAGGRFASGTIYLKSNVNLYIEAGAVLLGSDKAEDYPVTPSAFASYTGTFVTNKMLIYAESAENISISGRGTINGRGDALADGSHGSPSFSLRPRIIHFRGCENISIRDVKLMNAASWVQSYQSCRNLLIDGITVDSRPNKDIEKPRFQDAEGRNNDGLDLIDCQDVRISNCFINSGDDGICLKSFGPDDYCRNITITNCIISTNASGIKIGTETSGNFEDILIQNCVVYDTRQAAVGIMTVDGGSIDRVTVSGISMRNIKGAAIFIRLGNRNRLYRKDAKIKTPVLRNILIENIQGTRISAEYACSISGIPGLPVENIQLRNISLAFEGGLKARRDEQVPEESGSYPSGRMFGTLPAYGFYIRHAKNISLENVNLSLLKEDERPVFVCEDAEGLSIEGLKGPGSPVAPQWIKLVNSRNVVISKSKPLCESGNYLAVYGDKSEGIELKDTGTENIRKKIFFGSDSLKSSVTTREF